MTAITAINARYQFKGTVIEINRDKGFELDGLGLSNTRWFDASNLNWHPARTAQTAAAPQAMFSI